MSIKILDENTINKIAAGEVIENPSNIVKELVENSIDSGAKNIEISIKDGGIKEIAVRDDGIGFEYDDIKLAFYKHATSKLTKLEDLYDITSYGFRGEALSSIAAISEVSLISKNIKSDIGYKYVISYGKEIDLEEEASNKGTTIIIRNLFENVPVRKKFLKSIQKEQSNVYDIVIKLAYTRPDISFKFIVDGSVRFSTSGDGKLKNILYTIYGKEVYDNLIEVNDDIRGIVISGYIARPIVTRNTRNDEIYFINGRYVKNKIINKAIEEAYTEYLMQHKFPLVCLTVKVDSSTVDVNVHPKKEEVRFSNDDVIYYAVYNAIYNTLKKSNLIHNESLFTYDDEDEKNEIVDNVLIDDSETLQKKEDINELPTLKDFFDKKSESSINIGNLFNKFESKEKTTNNIKEETFIQKTLSDDHRYIGQIFDTYILVEYEEKLYIIDQHAAHEKINYENLMRRYKENNIASQKVFPSIMLKLTPVQYAEVEKNLEYFNKLGYEIELFGDNDIKVEAVPYNIPNISKKELLLEIIDSFASEDKKENYQSIIDRIASISCKKAIKAGRVLTEIEVKNLLRELFKLDNPYNCPHGRPTIISLSKSEFEKKFGRIV